MATKNPFKPTAGKTPPLLVGREDALDLFKEGIEDGPGAPGLLSIFIGARGIGKTVMLTEARQWAITQGWVVIQETATPGLMARLGETMLKHWHELGNDKPGLRITGLSIMSTGLTFELPPEQQVQWQELATSLTSFLAEQGTGLLFTVDEIHAIDRSELVQLAASVQHMISDDLPIGLLMAGIPKAVSDLLSENVAAFLRRADPVELVDVDIADVREALEETFTTTNVTLTSDQLDRAAEATGGYPFLIQLVGYHLWRLAVDGSLTDDAMERGLAAAKKRLGATVIATQLNDLSNVDRTFLLKMAEDNGPSRSADIATRLNEPITYAGVYRRRLLDAGVIVEAGYGMLNFAVPHLREYLREHAASLVARDSGTA